MMKILRSQILSHSSEYEGLLWGCTCENYFSFYPMSGSKSYSCSILGGYSSGICPPDVYGCLSDIVLELCFISANPAATLPWAYLYLLHRKIALIHIIRKRRKTAEIKRYDVVVKCLPWTRGILKRSIATIIFYFIFVLSY